MIWVVVDLERVRNLFLVVKRHEALALSIILALAMLIIRYPNVAEWNLGDNDNFMRLHQIKTFIESPSWYLHPLQDFNPQDGQIMHWSRLPDLPILAAYYPLKLFVTHELALQISISVLPLIYLLALVYFLTRITCTVFNVKPPFLTVIYAFFSVASLKFLPGHIDHHNLQLLLFSCFIWALFSPQYHQKRYLYTASISIALSLLIGLEALPFYILSLGFLAIYALYYDLKKLIHIRNIALQVTLFGALLMALFQPVGSWFNPQYDILTLPLLCFFLAAALSLSITKLHPTFLVLLLTTALCVSFTWTIFPDVLKPPFLTYPNLLIKYWLSHVSEARPLPQVFTEAKHFSSNWLYIGTIFPAIFSIFLLKESKQRVYYLIFLISLLPAIFWQVRTILFSSVLAIPLQVIIGLKIFHKVNTPIIRIIIPLFISPILFAVVISHMEGNLQKEQDKKELSSLNATDLIKQLGITGKKIFAPMDQGANIITLTNNAIITAPYHRNIRGNLLYINTLLSDDLDNTYSLLKREGIELFMFEKKDSQNKYMSQEKSNQSLLQRMLDDNPPSWLIPIGDNGDGITLYKLKERL